MFFGLAARKPQHIRKKKTHWKTKQKMAFEVFLCIGVFRGRKEAVALSLTLGLGWSLESTYFLIHILRKKKSLLNPQTRGAGTKPHFQERKSGKIQERHLHEKEEI